MGMFGNKLTAPTPELAQDIDRYASMPSPAAAAFEAPKRTFLDKLGLVADAFSNNDMNRRQLDERDMVARQMWQAQQRPEAAFAAWKRQQDYQLAHPKPINNDTVADYNFRAQMLGPDAANEWLKSASDPVVNVTLPGNRFYSGPRSGLATALGAGASAASPVPTAPVGKLKPIGGAMPSASRTFR